MHTLKNNLKAAPLLENLRFQAASGVFTMPDDAAYFARTYPLRMANSGFSKEAANQSIILRQLIERAIVRHTVADLVASGCSVSVYYGDGEYGIKRSTSVEAVMAEIGACDEEFLHVHPNPKNDSLGKKMGTIMLVYGNDGWDVLCDYHTSLEPLLVGANAFAESIGDAMVESAP